MAEIDYSGKENAGFGLRAADFQTIVFGYTTQPQGGEELG